MQNDLKRIVLVGGSTLMFEVDLEEGVNTMRSGAEFIVNHCLIFSNPYQMILKLM